jgi:hypothetical protein
VAIVDSNTSQKALDMILKAIGMRESSYKGRVTIKGKDPILASRHRFGELMAASQAALVWRSVIYGNCAVGNPRMS